MNIIIRQKFLKPFILLSGCFLIIIFYYRLSTIESFSLVFFENISLSTNPPNCNNLFSVNRDKSVIEAGKNWKIPNSEKFSDDHIYQSIKTNCDLFIHNQKYFLNPSNAEERGFPIAFSIVAFKSASQVERLLRTIYRPWNYYCVHIDVKANKKFFDTINELVQCLNQKYNNIVNTVNRIDVEWGKMSVLSADLNCMKELYERYKDWKYLINLTGQEFPLKTNAELVKILKAYNGANNLEGTYKRRNEERVPTVKLPIPIVWFKGSVHITVNRKFIAFIFESPISKMLLNALADRQVPDEQFFATLNHNSILKIPGSFIGDPDAGANPKEPLKDFLTRYKNWGEYPCESEKYVRSICIWGVGDLARMVKVPHLFANKFYEDFQPAALKCLEIWYYEKVKQEFLTGKVMIDESFYRSMPFVKHQYVPAPELIS